MLIFIEYCLFSIKIDTSNNIKNASQFAKTTSGIKCSDRNHHEDLIGKLMHFISNISTIFYVIYY